MAKQPKRKSVSSSPAVLPKRPTQQHNRYVNTGGFSATLDSVSISLSANTKDNEYSLPDLEGDEFQALRRYGLCLARYKIVDKAKFCKKTERSEQVFDTASRIIANYAYTRIYDDDPSVGTTHLAPLYSSLATGNIQPNALLALASYAGTKAFTDLLPALEVNPNASIRCAEFYGYIEHQMSDPDGRHGLKTIMKYAQSTDKWERGRYWRAVNDVCGYVEWLYNIIEHDRKESEKHVRDTKAKERKDAKGENPEDKRKDEFGRRKTKLPSGNGGRWTQAVLAKPELTKSHTGLVGRRIIAASEGKYVRNLSRMISDPQQRIFSRKTRALGGVVVVDCSGSMSLTEQEMTSIMSSSAGCTVIAYSDGGSCADPDTPNMWVVARKGRQVRKLPEFPGGNGVDGPALEYGLSLRVHNAPVIWISDTQVTGANGSASSALRGWCLNLCKQKNVYIVPNCETAIALLKKLQQGQRVINKTRENYNE